MSKYEVRIEQTHPLWKHMIPYKVTVIGLKENWSDTSYAASKWGARREAKKLIRKHEGPQWKTKEVERYEI